MMRPLIILSFFFSGAVHAFTVSSSGRFLGRFPLQAAPPTPIEVAQSTSLTTAETPSGLDERIYKLNKIIIDSVKGAIDVLYANNDYARFYVLETVARVPYFAYLSVMHLRETFGKRDPGDSERMRAHYAEADNELHHLLIMESLGGNSSGVDRALAQTMAFAYYWYVVGVYSLSEQAAYHLSELIEDHAYHTYDSFLTANEEKLRRLPVPAIARKYYEEDNPFLFDLFCTVKEPQQQQLQQQQQQLQLQQQPASSTSTPSSSTSSSVVSATSSTPSYSSTRPKLKSLYEVFVNIRNDEREHWKTLCSLVQFGGLEYGGSLQRGQGNSLDSFEGGAEGGSCLGGGGGQRRESVLQVVGTLPAPSPSNV